MSNKLQLTKFVARTVVSFGTGTIVTAIVRNNTTPANAFEQISIPAGSFVLGGIVANAAKTYTENTIDEFVGIFNKTKKEVTND